MLRFEKKIGKKLLILNLFVVIAILAMISSCSNIDSENTNSNKNGKIENFTSHSLTYKIDELRARIDELETKIDEVDNNRLNDSIEFVEWDNFLKFQKETDEELLKLKLKTIESKAVFNLKEKQGFMQIDANGHIFCVSVENVQPYLEGYKVVFKIGNPNYATFGNSKVSLKWNKSPLKFLEEYKGSKKNLDDFFEAWEKSRKKSDHTVLRELNPGVWNKVELLITPATLDEIEHVEFSLEVKTLSFYIDNSSP